MILEKIKKVNEQFVKIDATIEKALQTKAKIDEQIKALEEQQLILRGQYRALIEVGEDMGEFTVDDNGVITPIYGEYDEVNNEVTDQLNEPAMENFDMNQVENTDLSSDENV